MKEINLNIENYINGIEYDHILSEVNYIHQYYKKDTGVSIININKDINNILINLKKFNDEYIYIDNKKKIKNDITNELVSIAKLLISTNKFSLKNYNSKRRHKNI